MPPRRSHKKSKAGCQRCKSRKIKCDEVHPACGNCVKHGVSCDFDGGAFSPLPPHSPATSYHESTSGSHSRTSTSEAIPSPSSSSTVTPFHQTPKALIRSSAASGAKRLLELKLMHNFTARTSQTFADTTTQRNAWQVEVPTIAYDAPYLMDAILAVSALHMRSLDPEDQILIRASHGYMASAIQQYSTLLNSGLTESNAEALFATSALIAFQASASRRFEEFPGPDGYTIPVGWFHSFQGVKTIVMASWMWLRNSDRVYPIINGQPALQLTPDPERKSFFAPLLEGMEAQIEALPGNLRAETAQAYEHAVAFLNWAHQRPARNRILGFAATVSRRYVELVCDSDPRALVIVACFFAMTKVVDDVWWLEGIAKREANGIFSVLPPEWWGKMEWPLKIANYDGEIDENVWGHSLYGQGPLKMEDEEVNDVHLHIDMLANLINANVPQVPLD